MGAQALAIMSVIQGAFAIAPDIIGFATTARSFIAGLFTSGVITAAEQNEMAERVQALCIARLKGELPQHWRIDPDPVPVPDAPQAPV